MIDELAKAIWDMPMSDGDPFVVWAEQAGIGEWCDTRESLNAETMKFCQQIARAVLTRLMEPTHRMLAKGALALCEERDAQSSRGSHNGAADLANEAFRAMIGAAMEK